MRADVDKLKLRFKAERKEREALTELAAVHSEVFVDVQRKLEGHGQKLRTHEVQMTAMADESSEKFIALEVDLAATKKETKKVGFRPPTVPSAVEATVLSAPLTLGSGWGDFPTNPPT